MARQGFFYVKETFVRLYPYRTTTEKLEQAAAQVTAEGDKVISQHFVGGRDWILLCRNGEPSPATVATMSGGELGKVIADAVQVGVARGLRDRDRHGARR